MGATGYTIKGAATGGEEQKQVVVSAADGTIEVNRVETEDEIDFQVKTTYDGLETISCGSGYAHGYFRAIHVKFNHTDRRYRLVCIFNGSSYEPCRKDFAFYLIKMGYETGGDPNHAYIAKYSRAENDGFIALEKIANDEYNILIHTSRNWCWNNFGIMKEDKEDGVLIEHFNGNTTAWNVTGTLVNVDVPTWENGAPAEWQIIPDIVSPQAGMLGHYYPSDRNLYFFDGINWHLVYSLAQGIAQCLATTDAPSTARDGTIYYDTTERNLYIWQNGGWELINTPCFNVNSSSLPSRTREGLFRSINGSTQLQVYLSGSWQTLTSQAVTVKNRALNWNAAYNGQIGIINSTGRLATYYLDNYHYFVEEAQLKPQVVTFTNYSGETITADDKPQIIVTAAFGSVSILDLTDIEKEEGKTIDITNTANAIISIKDGATTTALTGCSESVVKCICLNGAWSFYKVSSLTPIV